MNCGIGGEMLKFLAGVGCGIAVGVLIAPKPGAETRAQLRRLATEPGEVAREKVAEARQKVSDMGANLGRQAAQKVMDSILPENLATGTDQPPR
jgi:gas vesicle protein